MQGYSCWVPDFSGVIGKHKVKTPLSGRLNLLCFLDFLSQSLVHLFVFLTGRLLLIHLLISLFKGCLLLWAHALFKLSVLLLI